MDEPKGTDEFLDKIHAAQDILKQRAMAMDLDPTHTSVIVSLAGDSYYVICNPVMFWNDDFFPRWNICAWVSEPKLEGTELKIGCGVMPVLVPGLVLKLDRTGEIISDGVDHESNVINEIQEELAKQLLDAEVKTISKTLVGMLGNLNNRFPAIIRWEKT